jgi:hypothetical protein
MRRRVGSLSSSLERRLNKYALAAAGVSTLALRPTAEAKIIYTPANARIKTFQHLYIDLNHDGINDLYLVNVDSGGNSGGLLASLVNQGNRMWGYLNRGPFASALCAGIRIGRHGQFQLQQYKFFQMAGWSVTTGFWRSSGQWWDVKNRYLGLKFIIKGKIHYGWARLSTKSNCPSNSTCHRNSITATLTGYAYETVPNKSIIAGRTHGPDVITKRDA